MPLPDRHANEPTVELDQDLYKYYLEAVDAVDRWEKELKRRRARLEEQLGANFAGTVNGVKVITYRPTAKYAEARLIKDFPDLTSHFFRTVVKEEFQIQDFATSHPEIADQYRTRSFRRVGEEDG
jgi:hypothetical protein